MFNYYLNNEPFTPINTGGFTFDINLVREGGAYHYVTELGGKIVFGGAAYAFIANHGDCQKIELRIEEICKEGTFTILELSFTNRDCEWKPDIKQVEVSPKPDTLYQCLVDNYDIKFNFLEVPFIVSTVFENTSEYEYRMVAIQNPIVQPNIPGWGTPVQVQNGVVGDVPFLVWFLYVREIKTTYCQGGVPQPPEGAQWELIEDNCLGRGYSRWSRKPVVFQGQPSDLDGSSFVNTSCTPPCVPPPPAVTVANEDWLLMATLDFPLQNLSFWVDYNVVKGDDKELDNGRLLTDVINYALNKDCPDLDLQSQFLFQDVNPVTGNFPSSTEGIQVHSISDVRDPDATEQATVENITLKEILEGYISSKLNCFWLIDEETNRLIIEHYSDLNNTGTFDLTAIEGGKWIRNKNSYNYDNSDIPRAEEFPSLDSSIDFTGVDIRYNNPCAEGNKAYNTDKFFSEVQSIIQDFEDYPNDGLVMITPDSLVSLSSTNTANSARVENGAITGDYAPNAPQAMANLHDKFWKYYRPFPNGELNFNLEEFNKNRPVKKLETIQIPLCCFRFFNPRASFIGNNFTNGQLQSATFNPASGFIELTIQYE